MDLFFPSGCGCNHPFRAATWFARGSCCMHLAEEFCAASFLVLACHLARSCRLVDCLAVVAAGARLPRRAAEILHSTTTHLSTNQADHDHDHDSRRDTCRAYLSAMKLNYKNVREQSQTFTSRSRLLTSRLTAQVRRTQAGSNRRQRSGALDYSCATYRSLLTSCLRSASKQSTASPSRLLVLRFRRSSSSCLEKSSPMKVACP